MSGQNFRVDVQGLRALAVLMVVAYHAELPLPGGYTGVDVFFVISGFVITDALRRQWERTGRPGLGQFYLRRARRLLPALAVMTAIVVPLSSLFSTFDARNQGYETAKSSSLFFANIQLMLFRPNGYFTSSEQTNPFLHTWSLSLEEQIYFIVPLGLFVIWWFSRRISRNHPTPIFLTATLVVMGFSLWASWLLTAPRDLWPVDLFLNVKENADTARSYAFYSPATRVWEFLAGSLVALVPSLSRPMVRSSALLIGLLGLTYAVLTFNAQSAFPGLLAMIPVASTVLLISSHGVIGSPTPFAFRPLQWVGDRSYSWYLWHWPLIQFVKATFPDFSIGPSVAAVASLGVAALSYRHIEQPIRNGEFWGRNRLPTVALLASCIAVPVLLTTSFRLEPTPEIDVHIDVTSGCVEEPWETLTSADTCIWRIPGARGDAVLIGDSQAGHLSESFIEAAHANGLNARVVTRTGAFFRAHPDRDYAAQVILNETKPKVVVLGQLTPFFDDIERWKSEASAYIANFNQAGIPVVFSHTIRKGGEPLSCATIRFNLLPNTCEIDPTESKMSGEEMPALHEHELEMLSRVPGNFALDANQILCSSEPCRSYQNGDWLWRDPSHLSIAGSLLLVPAMSDLIERSLTR